MVVLASISKDDGIETTDSGIEALWQASEKLELSARATQLDRC